MQWLISIKTHHVACVSLHQFQSKMHSKSLLRTKPWLTLLLSPPPQSCTETSQRACFPKGEARPERTGEIWTTIRPLETHCEWHPEESRRTGKKKNKKKKTLLLWERGSVAPPGLSAMRWKSEARAERCCAGSDDDSESPLSGDEVSGGRLRAVSLCVCVCYFSLSLSQ